MIPLPFLLTFLHPHPALPQGGGLPHPHPAQREGTPTLPFPRGEGYGAPHPQPLSPGGERGVRVAVLGEGALRLGDGRALVLQGSATLVRSAAGLVADAAGRPVLPQICVAGPFAVAMNGTVSVAGRAVGRLILQRAGGELGYPGEGTFGVLQMGREEGRGRGGKGNISFSLSPLSSSRPVIEIHSRTEVDGDRILLGDVADIEGGSARLKRIDLGEAPALGSRRVLTKWAILAVLRDAGVADGSFELTLPPDATVARRGQTVDVKTIVDAATEEAQTVYGDADLSMGQGPAPVLAPVGEVTLVASHKREGERMGVTVLVRVDGRTVAQRDLTFRAQFTGVKAGEAVRVFVARGGAVLETDGKAKTSGDVGDAIQILTAEGATLTATVTASGRVEVRL